MSSRLALTALLVPLVVGCAPPNGGSGGGVDAIHAVWEEDSDADNAFPNDAEPVSVDWTASVTIEGSMSSCGYDPDEGWPWTGDEDNYLVEVPAAGYLDATLSWESNSDLDLLIYFEPPGGGPGSISPDEQLAFGNDNGEIVYLFDIEYDEGDEVVFAVLCASGASDDYSLRIGWED